MSNTPVQWPNLLVSFTSALCYFDGARKQLREIERHRAPYYGISWNDDHVFVICKYGHEGTSHVAVFEPGNDSGKLRPVADHEIPVGNPHGCLWDRYYRHKLLIAASNIDAIVAWDPRDPARVETLISVKHDLEPGKEYVNSIWANDRYSVVGCHRLSSYTNRKSLIRIYDTTSLAQIKSVEYGQSLHSVFLDESTIVACDSLGYCLAGIDFETGKEVWKVNLDGFTRGIGRTRGGYVVGSSTVAVRTDRKTSDGWITLLDDDHKIVDAFEVNGLGGVHALRIVGKYDGAHQRDWRRTPIYAVTSTPCGDPAEISL